MSEDKRLRYRPVLARKEKLKKQHTTTSFTHSVTTESSIYGPYEPDPYGHSESPNHDGLKTKPRQTPVPKKVALDPVPTTTVRYFQDQEPSYFPEEPTYSILKPVSTPQNTAHTTTSPVYTTGAPTYGSDDPVDIVYDPTEYASPAYVLAPKFAPEKVSFASRAQPQQSYAHEPAFVPEPAYAIEPEYSSQPAFDPEPAYDHDRVSAPEPAYGSTYDAELGHNDHLDYSSEEEDAGAGIFDQYKYGYSVASEDTGNYHARSEARDGETVSGSYKVALPDGRVQVVTYIADEQGFRAEVTYEGEATLSTMNPTPPHNPSRPPVHASAFPPAQKVPDDFPTYQADTKALRPTTSSRLLQPSVTHPRRPAPQPYRHQFNGHDHPIHQAPIHTPLPITTSHHGGTPTPLPPHHSRTFSTPPIHNSTPATPSQNLHFGDHFHVTTASPNPFRLVVDKTRASTFSPLPLAPALPPSPPLLPYSSSSSSSYPSTFSSFRNSQRHQATTTPAPPTPTPNPSHDASVTPAFEVPFAATAHPVTNAHVADNGFRSTESFRTKSPLHSLHHQTTSTTPKSTTNAHTIAPAHRHSHPPLTTPAAPPPANLYEYDPAGRAGGTHTTLYNPDPDSRAYIHALGQAHAVPLLLPFSPPHAEGDKASTHPHHNVLPPPPRTYYLSQPSYSIPAYASTADPQIVRLLTPAPAHSAESVEITRGDEQRPRISIKVPEPHETDIYPAPRPRLRLR
ncbi:adhesive plaque matrix protein-like [Penaeus chinensis]|uniref:adhesive plaque matrix protein-like n=1 Tax=Penaeus chinensis TaxID=139456 RepID=UPI001FB5D989|nr:adhesive plaque matrix protein-like [Penaeus chinensis]